MIAAVAVGVLEREFWRFSVLIFVNGIFEIVIFENGLRTLVFDHLPLIIVFQSSVVVLIF